MDDGGVDAPGDGNVITPDSSSSCPSGTHTTVSGTVYDPAGRTPLYNVFVYIPKAPVGSIATGTTCITCAAVASGSPLASAQTDAKGHFQLVDVPVGTGIPLVMQLGKWRRTVTISVVSECSDNPVGQKTGAGIETLTRLPKKQSEGPGDNIPSIAIATGGCDALECLVRKIGVDDSEFGPGGRIQIYQGAGGASTATSTDAATTLWPSVSVLSGHDAVLASSECSSVDRQGAYAAVKSYVDAGGRFLATGLHYDWFTSQFASTAQWKQPVSSTSPPFLVDTTFPKGKALSDWIQSVFTTSPPPAGQVSVTETAHDVAGVTAPTTRWIYYGDPSTYGTTYLSFNAPVGLKPSAQCGRAAYSDATVGTGGGIFPTECGNPTDPLTQGEAAAEFLFFDLFSCIQDDTAPPVTPPQN